MPQVSSFSWISMLLMSSLFLFMFVIMIFFSNFFNLKYNFLLLKTFNFSFLV